MLSVALLAEVGRFLHSEVQRRRALDADKFPSDPGRAARLSAAMLEASDVAESGRGWGFIARVDAALAAFLAALGYSVIGGAFGGALLGKGLLFWVALSLGPAQLVFLAPAVGIGMNARQPQAVRAILRGSVPAFVVSAACFLWLVLAPAPAPKADVAASRPAPASTSALTAVEFPACLPGRSCSALLPEGWREVWRQGGGVWSGARYSAPWPGGPHPTGYVQWESRAGPDVDYRGERYLTVLGFSGRTASPVEEATLGGFPARRRRELRVDGSITREYRERWAAETDQGVITIECFGREPELDQAEAACRRFTDSLTFPPTAP